MSLLQVVLSGTGLKEGEVGQLAEFYIDGSKASDGTSIIASVFFLCLCILNF